MLGYIVVIDSLFFVKIDEEGLMNVLFLVGEYSVMIWYL